MSRRILTSFQIGYGDGGYYTAYHDEVAVKFEALKEDDPKNRPIVVWMICDGYAHAVPTAIVRQ